MLGDNIRSIRKTQKISINKLSKITGISLGYLSDLENNKAINPSVDKLKKIASALNVSTDTFFKDEFEELDITLNSNQIREECELYNTGKFPTAEAAMKFILKQPAIMKIGGFSENELENIDIEDFANEMLDQYKLISYKYKLKLKTNYK